MSEAQRKHKRYKVSIPGRIVLPEGKVCSIKINDISKDGLSFCFDHVIQKGSEIKVEYFVKYKNKNERVLSRVKVLHNEILSNNRGANVEVQYTFMPRKTAHMLSNVLHLFEAC